MKVNEITFFKLQCDDDIRRHNGGEQQVPLVGGGVKVWRSAGEMAV